MPHDLNGKLLQKDDIVMVPCKVTEVYATDEFCNVQVQTVHPMHPGDRHDFITLNAKQVVKADA